MGRIARTAAALLMGAVAAPFAAALSPTPVWAASGVASSYPANGAALAQMPAAIVLTCTGQPDVDSSHVAAFDATGARLNAGKLALGGRTVLRQPVRVAAKGTVIVAYHVVFTDGEEASGQLRFSVGTGVPPSAVPTDVQQAAAAAVTGHQHGVDPLSGGLLVVDAVVLVGAILLLKRPKRYTG